MNDSVKEQLREAAQSGRTLGITPKGAALSHRRSAVLMLFGKLDAVAPDLDVLLMRRSESASHHPGQISFPGGGVEPQDHGDPRRTALREAAEETALNPAGVEVLGSFADCHVPVSSNIVTPVLGWWQLPSEVAADHYESVDVFRVPVAELLDPAARGVIRLHMGSTARDVPAFRLSSKFGSHMVWGFTGLILDALFNQLDWTKPWDQDRTFDIPL